MRASSGDDDDVKDDEPLEHAEREVMEERRHYDDVASKWSMSQGPSACTLCLVTGQSSISSMNIIGGYYLLQAWQVEVLALCSQAHRTQCRESGCLLSQSAPTQGVMILMHFFFNIFYIPV